MQCAFPKAASAFHSSAQDFGFTMNARLGLTGRQVRGAPKPLFLDAGGTVYDITNNKAEGSASLTLLKLAAVIAGEAR